jgi:hypothetical protein
MELEDERDAMTPEQDLIGEAWTAVSSDDSGACPGQPTGVHLTGAPGRLSSRFAVEGVAVASVAAALLAAAALTRQRGGGAVTISLDRGHVADAVRSERFFSVRGQPAGASFAPLSRFWRVADGWVRTHANYPWHRRALLSAMGITEDADADALALALAALPTEEIEERVFAAGGRPSEPATRGTLIRRAERWPRSP